MTILLKQSSWQKALRMEPYWRNLKKAVLLLAGLFLLSVTAFAQNQILVKGHIVNEKNQPLPGVSVMVKGTSVGVTTDNNGDFQINAPAKGSLIITSVGFPEKEIPVNGKNLLTITITNRITDLDQVVVVGYGTQRKKDVTGSTVTLKGETLNEIKAPNIFNQLQGRAAGVDIVSNSTQIGAAGQIRIRGNRSITGNNDPLVVVDGMVYGGSINDINTDNVATIDVLKDASATAIYGSRGSNGVIIITTKRGVTGKPVTTYNGYVGMVNTIGTYRLFNGPEYAQFKEDARQGNRHLPPILTWLILMRLPTMKKLTCLMA